jgi:hypothetical protein
MLTTVSFRSSCEPSIFSRVSIIFSYQLPVPSCQFPIRVDRFLSAGNWQLETGDYK